MKRQYSVMVVTAFVFVLLLGACSKAKAPDETASAVRGQEAATAPVGQVAQAEASSAALETAGQNDGVTLAKGATAPTIVAVDINGREVNLDNIIKESPYLVIELFFTVNTGEDIAKKLRLLDTLYGRDKLRIIALGMKAEEQALKEFADRFAVEYYIIDADALENAPWLAEIRVLPFTMFVHPDNRRIIANIFMGGGKAKASLIKEVAQNFMFQGKNEDALVLIDTALEQGEAGAGEARGFVLTAAGKLDEAEEAFGTIGSQAGLAKVALDRGDLERAVQLAAAKPEDPYARTIKGMALMQSGKLDEAEQELEAVSAENFEEWQKSEAVAGMGRIEQEKGDLDGAIARSQEAIAINPLNVVALSNEGAAYREKGDLEKAADSLDRARSVRADDDLVVMMLEQVRREMQQANDIQRAELIRNQINDLVARYNELKEAGLDEPVDDWTTRPAIVAFLPSNNPTPVFFPRAGTEVVIRREIEARLQDRESVTVVEREMLDKLLQELQLGSSELADDDTRLRLGKVLSAGMLGFVEFAQTGSDIILYLRLVDTETTGIRAQITQNLGNARDLGPAVDTIVAKLLDKAVEQVALQGLIADASDENAVMINLGAPHGVTVGQRLVVIQEGEPVEVGGKVIAHRMRQVADLEVTEVNDTYSLCKVVEIKEGIQLAKEMKVKEVAP